MRNPDDPLGWYRFHLETPLPDGAAHLTILEGTRLRARLGANHDAPQLADLSVTTPDAGVIRASWRLEGNADQLSIAYSPTGQAPWTTLIHHAPDEHAELSADDLAAGNAPALRISARNGVTYTDQVIALAPALLVPPSVTFQQVSDGVLQRGSPLMLEFDTPMRWSALPAHISLQDGSGYPLPFSTVTDPERQTLALFLDDPDPVHNGAVHLTIRQPLLDAFGHTVAFPPEERRIFPTKAPSRSD